MWAERYIYRPRLAALWWWIAERYAGNPYIIGIDLPVIDNDAGRCEHESNRAAESDETHHAPAALGMVRLRW